MKTNGDKVLEAIAAGANRDKEIAAKTKLSDHQVKWVLEQLKKEGRLSWTTSGKGRARVRRFTITKTLVNSMKEQANVHVQKPKTAIDHARAMFGDLDAINTLEAIGRIARIEPGRVLQRLIAEEAARPLPELVKRWLPETK